MIPKNNDWSEISVVLDSMRWSVSLVHIQVFENLFDLFFPSSVC